MQTFRPSEAELSSLQDAARLLKTSNELIAASEKSVKSAKATLARWLKEARQLDVERLSVGDVVHIEGVALIEVSTMAKFDAARLEVEEPELHKKYNGKIVVKRFKPQL